MRYRKTGRYIYRNISGEGILVPVRDKVCNLENLLVLNETSSSIWEKFESREILDSIEIVSWLLDEYEVQPKKAHADVDMLLAELLAAGNLEKL